MGKTTQVAIRLEPDLLEEIDRLVVELSKRSPIPDVRMARSEVIRGALRRGVAVMQREIRSPKRKRK